MVPHGIRPLLKRTGLEFLTWGVRKMQPFKLQAINAPSVLIQVCQKKFFCSFPT